MTFNTVYVSDTNFGSLTIQNLKEPLLFEIQLAKECKPTEKGDF